MAVMIYLYNLLFTYARLKLVIQPLGCCAPCSTEMTKIDVKQKVCSSAPEILLAEFV